MHVGRKQKVALIALGAVILLTAIKAVFYYITGSMAALSESWHSASDIGTTLLAVIAVFLAERTAPAEEAVNESDDMTERLRRFDPELIVALIISLILLTVSSSILYMALYGVVQPIQQPLLGGLTFISISFISLFVYHLEKKTSIEENSSVLRADSAHHLSDTIISFLTGLSLLAAQFGLGFDRWMGGFIALLVLSIAIELFANVIATLIGKRESYSHEYRITALVVLAFQAETYRPLLSRLNKWLGWDDPKHRGGIQFRRYGGIVRRWSLRVILAGLLLGYLATMFRQVPVDRIAITWRFGKLLNVEQPLGPGWHMLAPWPIDSGVLISDKRIFTVRIGKLESEESASIWAREHEKIESFISGDNSILNIYATLQYRIRDPYAYHLKSRIDQGGVQSITEQILTRVFAGHSFYDLALDQRQQWTAKAEAAIQKTFDELNTGYEVVRLNIRDLHPPTRISSSYEAVVASYQEKETAINTATKQANEQVPKARAQAGTAVRKAEADSMRTLGKSNGEVARFLSGNAAYRRHPDIIRHELSLQKAEETLGGRPKTIIDPKTGIPAGGLMLIESGLSK